MEIIETFRNVWKCLETQNEGINQKWNIPSFFY